MYYGTWNVWKDDIKMDLKNINLNAWTELNWLEIGLSDRILSA
jgi:GH18 family chitinase